MLASHAMDALAPRAAALALLGCVAACSVVNPHYADGDTATAATSAAASATSDASETAAATSSPSSTTGTGTAGGTSSSQGSTTSTGSTTADATTGALTDATTDATTSGTTEAPPPPMRLQHYADGQCELPLWCYAFPNIWDGLAARFYTQECFTGLTPPFRITRIGYSIAATRGTPSDPAVALRSFNGVTPSADPILPPVLLTPGDVTPGYHEVALDYMVDASSFCIGVVAGDFGTNTGLGMAVDKVAPPPGQSFYRVNGQGGCNSGTSFLDIAATKPNPTGQWCIDVDLQPL